jgi:hypothetical protein
MWVHPVCYLNWVVTHGAQLAERTGDAEHGETISGEEKTGFASLGSEMG